MKPHRFRQSGIVFVLGGTGVIFVNGTRYPLTVGTTVLVHPNDSVQIINQSRKLLQLHLLHYQSIQFKPAYDIIEAHSAATSLFHDSEDPTLQVSHAFIDTFLYKCRSAMQKLSERNRLKLQIYFNEMLLYLQDQQTTQTLSMDDNIRKTITYMEENYAKPLQLNEMPSLAGMTQSSYCRAFKKLTTMTPGNYLTQIRMLRAKELMMDRHSTLREIAVHVGYQDELYFSRVFKKTEGMSPSAYLQRSDKKIAVVSRYLLQDHLLALGYQPIAAPAFPKYFDTPSGFPSYLHKRLQGTIPLDADRPISSSDVLHLGPDIIFKAETLSHPNDHQWNRAGNTLFIHASTSWEQYLRVIAKRMEKEPEAERIIRNLAKLEQKTRKMLTPITRQGSWVIIRLMPGDCRLYGIKDHTLTDLFYQRLQFKPDERITHAAYQSHAFERLIELNPEHILIIWSEAREIEAVQQDPRWSSLQAVRNNHIYIPESKEWDPWGPIGREVMLQAMVDYFLSFV